MRETKDFKKIINFNNKQEVIKNIENDLVKNEIIKDKPDKYDFKNENNSSVLQIRKKKKESEKYDEQLKNVKKKNKLLDFIMVKYLFYISYNEHEVYIS